MSTRKSPPSKSSQVQPTSGPKWAFGKVLREFREGKDISQEKLAEAAGLDRSFISLVERGLQTPNIVVLFKMAHVLEVKPSELINEMETRLMPAPAPPET